MSELSRSLKKWFFGWLKGGPHFVVGPAHDPYLHRWYILPRNPWFNVYIHKFLRDDDDRALHDHPWPSVSLLLWGKYLEETFSGYVNPETGERHKDRVLYGMGKIITRSAEYTHRVELPGGKPCWTLFITGPRVREWGFHCPQGWVHWQDFVAQNDHGNIGKGCDQ